MDSSFSKCVLLSFLLGATAAASAQNSVSYQINAQHTGATVFQGGLKLPLKQLWTRNLGGLVTYPLLAGNLLFVSVADAQSYGSVYYALDRSTGATVWSHPIAGTYFTSLAAYDSGAVFVLNYNGVLTAFAAETGKTLWQVQLPTQYSFGAAPTASAGVIYINGAGDGATVYAVRESNGDLIWSTNTDGSIWGAPTLSEDGVFVSYPCQAYEFDQVTGALRWNYNGGCDGGGGITTAYYDQILFTSGLLEGNSQDGNAVLAYNGHLIGNLGNLSSSLAYQSGIGSSYPPALQGGMAYFVSDAQGLVARNTPNLKEQWHFAGDNSLSPAAIVVNGHVIVASSAGHLYVLDGSTGHLEQTLSLPPGQYMDEGGVPNGLAAGNGVIAVPYLENLSVYAGSP